MPTSWTEQSGPAPAFTEGVSGAYTDYFTLFLFEGVGATATAWSESSGPAGAFSENTGPAPAFTEQGT